MLDFILFLINVWSINSFCLTSHSFYVFIKLIHATGIDQSQLLKITKIIKNNAFFLPSRFDQIHCWTTNLKKTRWNVILYIPSRYNNKEWCRL